MVRVALVRVLVRGRLGGDYPWEEAVGGFMTNFWTGQRYHGLIGRPCCGRVPILRLSMSDNSTQQCLAFDNDISGIGVRIAIYTQNFLVFLPVIWNIRDGYVALKIRPQVSNCVYN